MNTNAEPYELFSPFTQISKNIEQLIEDAEDKLDMSLLGRIQKQQLNDHQKPIVQANSDLSNGQRGMKRSLSVADVPTRSLFIGNLDPTVTEEELRQKFADYGKIESLRLLPNKECAFVNFTSVEEAVQAKMAMTGRPIGHLIPRIGFGKVSTNQVVTIADSPSVSRSVWVGQLSSTITKEALLSAFMRFGPIETIRITGNRSCAFIDFCSLECAIKAKNSMNGYKLAGSIIKTGYARGCCKTVATSPTNKSASPKRVWMTQMPVTDDVLDFAEEEEDNNYNPVASPMTNERFDMPLPFEPESMANVIDETVMQKLKELQEIACIGVEELEQSVLPNAMKLARDMNGNILIQRIIERLDMNGFRRIFELFYPHFLSLAIDRHGTWVIQRLILLCRPDPKLKVRVIERFKPYIVTLMQDQFGNYAIQCCLSLGSSANIILKVFYHHLPEIGKSRFGSRALKNALETSALSGKSRRHLTKAICNNAWELVNDGNGIILVHWLLDANSGEGIAHLASQLQGQFVGLTFGKPTAAIISKMLLSESIVKELIVMELFEEEKRVKEMLGSAVATAVLVKAYNTVVGDEERKKRCKELLLRLNNDKKKSDLASFL